MTYLMSKRSKIDAYGKLMEAFVLILREDSSGLYTSYSGVDILDDYLTIKFVGDIPDELLDRLGTSKTMGFTTYLYLGHELDDLVDLVTLATTS